MRETQLGLWLWINEGVLTFTIPMLSRTDLFRWRRRLSGDTGCQTPIQKAESVDELVRRAIAGLITWTSKRRVLSGWRRRGPVMLSRSP